MSACSTTPPTRCSPRRPAGTPTIRPSPGWADVRHEIEYKDEVPAGALVEIFGTITRVGNSSLETRYEMRRASTGAVAATILAKTVFFDLKQRKASPLTEAMRQGIERFLG
jgi:acyl-CoA thioester hydrolase